jgi:very-short-patch-repair endonuclease
MTGAERKLWLRLRQWPNGKAHFRRQATVGPYFADFACHSNRLIVEVDGGQHAQEAHIARDSVRDGFFRAYGYRVLRFWNHDVMKNVEGVMEIIAAAIDGNSTAPHP